MKYSIITISYNAEKVIASTINSVIEQNYENIEYIFIDGASSDNTNEIIEKNKQRCNEKHIKVVHISEPDNGISDAFNKGILLANGEIICIINAGDMLNRNALHNLDECFSTDIDILYGNIRWIDKENKLNYIRKPNRHIKTIGFQMCFQHPATFIRRNAYNKVGLYDTNYKICMDQELLLRMLQQNMKFKYVDFEFAIMEAGGVSDQRNYEIRRVNEGKLIAQKCGISMKIYNIFLKYQKMKDQLKFFAKKHSRLYNFISK